MIALGHIIAMDWKTGLNTKTKEEGRKKGREVRGRRGGSKGQREGGEMVGENKIKKQNK